MPCLLRDEIAERICHKCFCAVPVVYPFYGLYDVRMMPYNYVCTPRRHFVCKLALVVVGGCRVLFTPMNVYQNNIAFGLGFLNL